MSSAPSIVFDVRPSRLLLTIVAVMALLAMLAVILASMTWWLKVLLCMGVTAYTAQGIRHHLRQPVRRASWHADGSWVLHLAHGSEICPELVAVRTLGALTFLHFSPVGKERPSLALLPDNVDAETRRRLRMRLAAWSDK